LRKTALHEPSRVKSIQSVFFAVENPKKEGKKRYKKSRRRCILPIREKASCEKLFYQMLHVGRYAVLYYLCKIVCEKLRDLG